MSDNSALYEDLSLFENFAGQVQKDFEDSQNGDFEKQPITYPVVSGKTTTWKLRFHPLIKTDPDTGGPKLVLTRTVWNHGQFESTVMKDGKESKVRTRRIPCSGKDCPVCAETRKLKDAKHQESWKYSAKKEALAPVYITESTAGKDYKYQILNAYGFIQLRNKAIDSLNAFLTNLSPEEMKQVLNPRNKAQRIMFTVSGGSEGSASWGFDIKQMEMPPLPDDFPDIDKMYCDETEKVTEEELSIIRKTVNKMLAEMAGTMVDPDDEEATAPAANPNKPAAGAKSAVADALKKGAESGEATKPAAADTATEAAGSTQTQISESASADSDVVCPGAAENLKFGAHPVTLGGDICISCLSCPHETACEAKTKQDNGIA